MASVHVRALPKQSSSSSSSRSWICPLIRMTRRANLLQVCEQPPFRCVCALCALVQSIAHTQSGQQNNKHMLNQSLPVFLLATLHTQHPPSPRPALLQRTSATPLWLLHPAAQTPHHTHMSTRTSTHTGDVLTLNRLMKHLRKIRGLARTRCAFTLQTGVLCVCLH